MSLPGLRLGAISLVLLLDLLACRAGNEGQGRDGRDALLGACAGGSAGGASVEVCNGIDDDCDGDIDESDHGGPLRRPCNTACGSGAEECSDGAWTYCSVAELAEQCNGIDDDCNGEIDETCACRHGETRACGPAVGACRRGVQQCVFGAWTEACRGGVEPMAEICGNGIDDDCDDDTDESCACAPASTQACGIAIGACERGTQTCSPEGTWSRCSGAVVPSVETCNGIDDDCDGAPDWSNALGAGWRADTYESNNTCATATTLPVVVDGADWMSIPVADRSDLLTYPSIYPIGDEDWYVFRAQVASHGICFPGAPQCAFVLRVGLELQGAMDPGDVEFCVDLASDCGATPPGMEFCAGPGDWVPSARSYLVSVKWGGICATDDSRDIRVRVRSKSAARTCDYYQLSARLTFDPNEPCPG